MSGLERRLERLRLRAPALETEYPFTPHALVVDGHVLSYVDERPASGAETGGPVLCVHGNPTWSFFFRRVVSALRGERRVVAVDHLGCGLSDKPAEGPYTLAGHVSRLEKLVLELDLEDLTLLVHDWGGAIGLGFAARHPERVSRLVITNTAAFRSDRVPRRIRICRPPLVGDLLVRGLNGFALGATHMAVTRPMPPEIRRAYVAPYRSWSERVALLRFVQDIPLAPDHPSWNTLVEIEGSLERWKDVPTCIVWGERDWCFTPHFREEWEQRLPNAEVHRLPDAGHYLLEDAPEEVLEHVTRFLSASRQPCATSRSR